MTQISKAFRRNNRTDLHVLAKQYLETQVHCELRQKQLAAMGVGPGVRSNVRSELHSQRKKFSDLVKNG